MDFDFSIDAASSSLENLEKKTYETDSRFFQLKKDKDGNGAALIRFLPSEIFENGQMSTMKVVYRYNVRSKTSKAFISEWSPSTIGKTDPIQEKWASLWNAGKKEESQRYARSTRYIANIKVINHPANPEDNGKIFLLDMSKTLGLKVKSLINPPEAERAMGVEPKNLFNPMQGGFNFMLVARIGANGFTNYDSSKVAETSTSIYNSKEEAIKDIADNCYKLSDWDKEESYKSYDELKAMLDNIDNPVEKGNAENPGVSQTSQNTQTEVSPFETQTEAVPEAKSLDELMASLGK